MTPEELKIMLEVYPARGSRAVVELLPHRNMTWVKTRAQDLGLKLNPGVRNEIARAVRLAAPKRKPKKDKRGQFARAVIQHDPDVRERARLMQSWR